MFTDRALGKQAGRFVWLSIDTEKDQNRAFVERHPIDVWPTLMVIDPATDQPVLRWAGSATVPELEQLLDDGERAVHGEDPLGRADRLAAEGKPADAARVYREALPSVPAGKRARVVESLIFALDRTRDTEGCAALAQKWIDKLRGPALVNVVGTGLGCALNAPAGAPWKVAAVAALRTGAEAAVDAPGVLADDRSGLYEVLVEAHKQAGDAAGARALARRWSTFLEAEAARAGTPEARASFDPHRVVAAIAGGEPARAIPELQASERELPADYNPAARLALLYQALGRNDDALAACDRALAKVYGPRRKRLADLKTRLLEQKRAASQ